jgi:hypothetical protein
MRKAMVLALAAVIGSVISGGIGAICGLVIGWAACVWINKPRMHGPVPSVIPRADVSVQSRKNCRPLTWLYRPLLERDGTRTRSS